MGHPGNKGSHVVFLGDMNMLFSTGFSRMNERQLALWDVVRDHPSPPFPILYLFNFSGIVTVHYLCAWAMEHH